MFHLAAHRLLRALADPQKRRLWRWLFVLTWLAVTALALHPRAPEIGQFENADKLRHMVAFGTLVALAQLTRSASAAHTAQHAAALVLYGIGIEIAQLFVPGREASLADVVADCLGITLGLLALAALRAGLRRWANA
jgi:VanZ family protein